MRTAIEQTIPEHSGVTVQKLRAALIARLAVAVQRPSTALVISLGFTFLTGGLLGLVW